MTQRKVNAHLVRTRDIQHRTTVGSYPHVSRWRLVTAVVVLSLVALNAACGQRKPPPSSPSDTLREQASHDPDALGLVELAEALNTLVLDTARDPTDLRGLQVAYSDLQSARTMLSTAQERLTRARKLWEDAEQAVPSAGPYLTEFRTAHGEQAKQAACLRMYRQVDPQQFDLTVATCAAHYNPNGLFEIRPRALHAGLMALGDAVRATSSRVVFLEHKLATAQDTFQDKIRGTSNYKWILFAGAATTLIILLMLTFAHEDVRRKVYANVHVTELVTLVLVVMAVIFFGAMDILKSDAVSGLLGAIAGYVLGRQPQKERVADAPGTAQGTRRADAEQRVATVVAKKTQPQF